MFRSREERDFDRAIHGTTFLPVLFLFKIFFYERRVFHSFPRHLRNAFDRGQTNYARVTGKERERERKETRLAIVTIEIISTRENSFGKLFQFARSLRERDPAFLPHSFENRG